MENYKRGSHTVWDCKYHIVWTTKYRYTVLGGDTGHRCRELLREIARSKEMMIHAGSINRDHVHLLISIPPNLSVSKAVQYLKGKSSHKLLSEYQQLRKRYWGQHFSKRFSHFFCESCNWSPGPLTSSSRYSCPFDKNKSGKPERFLPGLSAITLKIETRCLAGIGGVNMSRY